MILLSFGGVLSVMSLFLAQIWIQHANLRHNIEQEVLEDHKKNLLSTMTMIQGYIHSEQHTVENRLYDELRYRMDHAWSIISYIEAENPKASQKKLISKIAESLRPIRFHDGNGYYFITGYDSIEILFPPQPERFEGKNMFLMDSATRRVVQAHDSIVQNHGSGFYSYLWTKPFEVGLYKKISYVRGHPKLRFLVGTGIYNDDIKSIIQHEVRNLLSKMKSGPDAYFFAVDWQGNVQVGPGAGLNKLHIQDQNGLPVVRRFIELSKNGGGFLEYYMPTEVSSQPTHKISYVIGIPEWQWYVGIGVDIRNIEKEVQIHRTKLIHQSIGIITIASLVSLLLLLIITYFSKKFTQRVDQDLQKFIRFTRDAELKLEAMPTQELTHSELQIIAEQVNGLVTRFKALSQSKDNLVLELQDKNHELEQVLYVAGHDLRNPLVSIQGFVSELRHDCEALAKPNAPQNELFDSINESNRFIRSACEKMDLLIQGILRYGRIGRIQLILQPIEMNSLVQQNLQAIQFLIQESHAKITIQPLPACYADPTMVNQIIANLLENALKYKSPDRILEIKISGEMVKGFSTYCIEDNGRGIPTKDIDRIFGIFIRLHSQSTIPGEGLGLAVSKRMAQRMDGLIWATSDVDVGSRFYLKLPAIPS